MSKYRTVRALSLTLLPFALMPLVANAQASPNYNRPPTPNLTSAPKVVFIGDNTTVDWTSAFSANPNWINRGTAVNSYPSLATASSLAGNFQQNVVALHPAVVHILMGMGDAGIDDDASFQFTNVNFLTGLESMVKQAKAANIQVVLGIEPLCGPFNGSAFNGNALQMINSIIGIYGAQNNIPVINYGDALCHTVGATAGLFDDGATPGGVSTAATVYGPNPSFDYLQPDPNNSLGEIPNTAGYALMTQMAEATINTLNATLLGGYLQNSQVPNDNEDDSGVPNLNVNTVAPAAVLQFIPFGAYSNGVTEPLINTSFLGTNGTWASSNPLVMYVNQQGQAFSISPGTAIITYTSPTGVKFSEWIMYVGNPTG